MPTIPIPPLQIERLQQVLARTGPRSGALGGALALAAYTGAWRDTKDVDLYIAPARRADFINTLSELGYTDYHPQLPYDRSWIYRGYKEDLLFDIIWAFANAVTEVDEQFLTLGKEIELGGSKVRVIPAEELIWSKMFVLQRERCDWGDILNVLYFTGEKLDWQRLLGRVGEDWPLLQAIMNIFVWLCPGQAERFPDWIWGELCVRPPAGGELINERNVRVIDSRPWFTPLIQRRQKEKGQC